MDKYLLEYVNLIGGKRKKTIKIYQSENKRENYIRHRYLESYDDYINNILPRALKINNKQWLIDLFDRKKTRDRIVYEDDDFIFIHDIKWNGENKWELRMLAFFRDPNLHSMRDLTGKHLPLLKKVKKICLDYIEKNFGLVEDQLKLFFHYRPSIWQLHLHFNCLFLKNSSSSIERAHSLYSIMENLELDSDYFKKIKIHCFNDIDDEK